MSDAVNAGGFPSATARVAVLATASSLPEQTARGFAQPLAERNFGGWLNVLRSCFNPPPVFSTVRRRGVGVRTEIQQPKNDSSTFYNIPSYKRCAEPLLVTAPKRIAFISFCKLVDSFSVIKQRLSKVGPRRLAVKREKKRSRGSVGGRNSEKMFTSFCLAVSSS